MPRVSYAEAAEVLASRDQVLAGLIADAGPIRISRPRGGCMRGGCARLPRAPITSKSTPHSNRRVALWGL